VPDDISDFESRRVKGSTSETVNLKWGGPELLEEGFVPFPKRLLRCMSTLWGGDTTLQQLAVILAIADYRRPKMTRLPSVGVLAHEAGLATDVFDKRMKELVEMGYLQVSGSSEELKVSLTPLVEAVKTLTSGEE
jgi:hypothetical protein